MGFSETKIQKHLRKGGTFKHTFIYKGDKEIKRINPLCDCIKSFIQLPELTFWYKTDKTANKIVVITYDDLTVDFLELQSIIQ